MCDCCNVRRATRRGYVCGIETFFCAICAGEMEEDQIEVEA